MNIEACLVKVTVIFLLAWVVSAAARRSSAAVRAQIWAIAILCAMLLPLLQITMPAWHAGVAGRAVELWGIADQRSGAVAPPPHIPSMTIDAAQPVPWGRWVFEIWVLGVSLALLRLVWSWAHLRRLSRRARPLPIDGDARIRFLISQDARAMPSTWGLLRPNILLPADYADWPSERRRVVLAHEFAHVRRCDWPFRIAAELARAVYWFHPLAWLALRRLRNESELACDDAVLASGVQPGDYAGELLDLVRTARAAASAALAVARPSNLERRFTAMLDPTLNRRGLTRNTALLTTAASLLLLLPFGALRAPAEDTGKLSGAVSDPSGTPVVNATVIMTNANGNTKDMTVSDHSGQFHFVTLPAGSYHLRIIKEGFEAYDVPQVVLESGSETTENVTLSIGMLNEEIDVRPAGAVASSQPKIRVGGNVQMANLITQVHPIYPASAKEARIQGSVLLQAVISTEGVPLSLRVMNSEIDPDLAKAAVEAVSQWRYRPTLLNGDPVEVITNITVNFTLSQ